MSDTDPTTDDASPDSTAESPDSTTADTHRARRYANYAVLVVLGLLAFIAVVQLYLSISRVITTWIDPEYRSLFQAAFNLVVLLVTGVGISYQLRRLYG
jgi:uncharacterized membrane protein